MEFDLGLYLERIGLTTIDVDNMKPDLDTLKQIQLADMQCIPFENMDIVNKKLISIEIGDICDKILKRGRGGYCYEKSTLLMVALRTIGYHVTPMLARVLWMTPGVLKPFTHLILVVKLFDIDYLVDVGFGGLGSTAPLKLFTDEVQRTDGLYRLIDSEDNYKMLQIQIKEEWNDMYRFQLNPALDCDMIQTNWYSCTHPDAKWCICLYACRVIGLDRVYIYNSEYCTRKFTGELIKTKIENPTELMKILQEIFGIYLDFMLQNDEDSAQKLGNFEEYATRFLEL